MYKPFSLFILAAMAFSTSISYADESGRVIDFPAYHCRLTLPDPCMEWLDHSQVPQAQAVFGDAQGTIVIFMVHKIPAGLVLNESFTKGFDETFERPGVIRKTGGEITTFSGAPCYHLYGRLEQEGKTFIYKLFAANGFMYGLQLISGDYPGERAIIPDNYFSAFEFIGEPLIAKPRGAASQPQTHNISRIMGRVIGYCVIGIVVISVIKWLVGRGRK